MLTFSNWPEILENVMTVKYFFVPNGGGVFWADKGTQMKETLLYGIGLLYFKEVKDN